MKERCAPADDSANDSKTLAQKPAGCRRAQACSLVALIATVHKEMRTAVAALICSRAAPDAAQLLAWAQSQGATVSPHLAIRRTSYGGNGLFVNEPVAKGTPLVRIPGDLQLGVEVLAKSDAVISNASSRACPGRRWWRRPRVLPCAAAICAERRNAESRFAPYLRFLMRSSTRTRSRSAPRTTVPSSPRDAVAAEKVKKMRYGLRARRERMQSISTSSCWAAAVVCSRSLRRRVAPPLSPEAVDNVGPVAATDRSLATTSDRPREPRGRQGQRGRPAAEKRPRGPLRHVLSRGARLRSG